MERLIIKTGGTRSTVNFGVGGVFDRTNFISGCFINEHFPLMRTTQKGP